MDSGVVLAAALAIATLTQATVGVDPEAYRHALTGTVRGRVYEEARRPRAPESPLQGAAVTLVPLSESLLARLEGLRNGARASRLAYREAVTEVRKAREAYEKALWEAGGPDLVYQTTADATGAFTLEDVPAGSWILFGSHAVFVPSSSARAGRRNQRAYDLGPRVIGYDSVRLWLRRIEVTPGRAVVVELSDRGVWFEGPVEEAVLETGR